MSTNEITVHVNRGDSDSLEVEATGDDTATDTEPASAAASPDPSLEFEGARSGTLILRGHGTPAHVHCRLDGDLARVASIDRPNYYVEPDDVTAVPIALGADVDLEGPIEGRLEVLTGYGSESVAIDVIVRPGPPEIDVDETLAEPSRTEPDPSLVERLAAGSGIDPGTIAVGALGLVAVAIATMTAMTIGGLAAMAGLVAVVVGVVVAGFLLLSQ
ncbi:hypothetical protein SAMN05444422_101690 [Halobiforma haloterrestris]|uniref:Uncharacterized protein n=1 Tax=Natronobacterium haloterrestre TaxID=148448 RepID=A0A1I1DNW9_NATHA|nr:hypothetical protein [Halobiforma haloterrestris]SFB74748.1 hypothetical protein SAMN05444422_101690 [Halobiforma haloterrestris]